MALSMKTVTLPKGIKQRLASHRFNPFLDPPEGESRRFRVYGRIYRPKTRLSRSTRTHPVLAVVGAIARGIGRGGTVNTTQVYCSKLVGVLS